MSMFQSMSLGGILSDRALLIYQFFQMLPMSLLCSFHTTLSLIYINAVLRCLMMMYQLYPWVHQTSKLIFLKLCIIIMSLGGVLQFTNCRVFILVLWLSVAQVLTKLRFW